MTRGFVHSPSPTRVVFGAGTVAQVAEEVRRLGGSRVLLLARPRHAGKVAAALGDLVVAQFDGARMHTPVEVTAQALDVLKAAAADCVVAVGGGSATGLAKALAARTGVPQVILPTTYAGSEVTPVLGETENGRKTTRRSPDILPETVIYDVDLTLDLPVPTTVTSAINALAHAVEALYSPDANPVVDAVAVQAIRGIAQSLPLVAAHPSDVDARAELLESAWLAGSCLASVSMGLHHKLCHQLGGQFDLPHAETHTVMLPQVMAYKQQESPEALAKVAEALDVPDAAAAVYDLVTELGGPTSLRELGLPESSLDGIEPASVLHAAWAGIRPDGAPDLSALTAQVLASFDDTPDPRLKQLITDLVRHLHHFAVHNDLTEEEWLFAIDFLTRTGQISDDKRKEFVLLSDTLGVSSIVDALTNSRSPLTTPSAVLGPFYVEGPPAMEHGADISGGLDGEPLWVSTEIVDTDGEPVPGAVVDVWQANKDGFYDVQLAEVDGPVLRARFVADDQGKLTFWTTLPHEYPVPEDGPVGQMLNGTARHPYRAPHVHFMIMAPHHHTLVTQLFVKGGAYLDSDTVFGVKNGLIVDFPKADGEPPAGRAVTAGGWHRLDYTFRIGR
ncbi:MAG TPA: maleylacetate reductase and hydroxyquinol 1,2-dioxygenase domain-containing protein [Kutzneria sp.]|nr:maleylacetate reductase and hydroxyquinol 1,2-dioxygenase domain-containing protein [Kutzneria sp.]